MEKEKTELFHGSMFLRAPETPQDPMEFLSRSWSSSALELCKALSTVQLPPSSSYNNNNGSFSNNNAMPILEDIAGEADEESAIVSGNPFSFASSETSQMVMDRIMSQSQEVSPRTSGRLSHSSGPLNGSLTDSPPVSPTEIDDFKAFWVQSTSTESLTSLHT